MNVLGNKIEISALNYQGVDFLVYYRDHKIVLVEPMRAPELRYRPESILLPEEMIDLDHTAEKLMNHILDRHFIKC